MLEIEDFILQLLKEKLKVKIFNKSKLGTGSSTEV